METFTTEMLLFLCALTTTISSSVNAEGCDAELWSHRSGMKIKAPTSYFTEKLFTGDTAVDECREWCNGESGCRAVSLVEASGQKTCKMYNHSVVILESDTNSDTLIKDFWESDDSPICPPTSMWDSPDNWPIDVIPSFYQPMDKRACVEMSGTEWSYGWAGNAIVSSGSVHFADIITPEMVNQDPSSYCWLTPNNCPDGMTFAMWTNIIFRNTLEPIITSVKYDQGPSEGFGIKFHDVFGQANIAIDVQLATRLNGSLAYTPLESGVWIHIAFTFISAGEITMYKNGLKLHSAPNGYIDQTVLNPPKTLRLGKHAIGGGPVASSAGRWDEIVAFNKVLSDSQMAQLPK